MRISIVKRNSQTLDISLNSDGKKLVYNTNPQNEITVNNTSNNPPAPNIQNNNSDNSSPKLESKPSFNIVIPKKQKEEKITIQFSKPPSNKSFQSPKNSSTNDKFHYKPNENDFTDESKINNEQEENPNNKYKTIKNQKDYIESCQKLINEIISNQPQKLIHKLQLNIEKLWEMLQTIILFNDSVLNETKILISYINLFLNESVADNFQLNGLYFIFFDESEQFIIGPKLHYYFNSNVNPSQIEIIIKFTKKLCSVCSLNQKVILDFYQKVSNSKEITISEQTKNLINQEIAEIQTEITSNPSKKQFHFEEQKIFNKLDDSELTNNYKSPWPSFESYIKVMVNLSVENFFYPFRIHLNELRNDELDPRDLYLYEKVKIAPCNTFDEKSEYDFFIQCSIRAPNYKDGNTIKPHKLRKIDWEFTDRLSNRSLLFFSFSSTMEKIEAVAISRAKKGEITDSLIVPISVLQGKIEIDKEYFMFEPIDHWNGPFFNNLLNTNETTLPKSLLKPFVSLDFSENLNNQNETLFNVAELFKKRNDFNFPKYEIKTSNEDVEYFCSKIISKFEGTKKVSHDKILNDLCNQMNILERQRGSLNKIDPDSEIVKTVSHEIQRYLGYLNINEKWPFDSVTTKELKEKCAVDNEQYRALKYSLNHHLTLVNGAPGTGKTYLACELVKLLIKSQYQYPILVVTYKNVSLDGFLDNIADFLQQNEVNFVRIGGKPRTENKFILEKQLERKIPLDIHRMKNQIINLTSMQAMINNYLNNTDNDEYLRSLIVEMNESINIKQIMFNQFPFYSNEDEKIITNFYESAHFIPSADKYLNCWLLGKDYYDDLKLKLNRTLHTVECNFLQQFIEYLNKNKSEKNNETIDEIIVNHFSGNEKNFLSFLNNKKKRILEKDTSILSDILNEKHDNSYFEDDDERDRESDHLIYYLNKGNSDLLPKPVNEIMKEKFIQMISTNPNDKLDSLKQFLIETSKTMLTYTKIIKEESFNRIKEFEKKEIIDLSSELSKKSLIAMTATRVAQYKSCLDHSNCKFMIVEEAGELTEPMAVSIVPKPIENLVMIGDYRQLRPTVEHKLKFSPYNHDISLFEKEVIQAKTIKADNLFTLSIQRRMHPQISKLLRRSFYNDNKGDEQLNDDESTFSIEKPLGFPNHIQFWFHEFEEETENLRMRSHVNIKEAQICAYLFMLMLCRGYKSSEITIVSLYKGQKRQIERELCKLIDLYYNDDNLSVYDAFDFENDQPENDNETHDLNELIEKRKTLVGKYVKCIDDFQGEENEVIIISLTRSEKPGFVKNDNRALVTLSRAKQMEFVIGNINVFGQENNSNPLWQRITKEAALVDQNTFNTKGIIASPCSVHSRQKTNIILSKPNHFIECRFNCCTQNCKLCSFCGHKCFLPCHFHSEIIKNKQKMSDLLKRRYFCEERCSKRCKKGHQCEEMCGNCSHFGCPPCKHSCDNNCSLCNRKCALNCSHQGDCQCRFSGCCTDCHAKLTDLHKNLKFWNGNELLCNKCFFRRVESRKFQKGYF